MSMMEAIRSDMGQLMRACENSRPMVFDPYEEAEPVCVCKECGDPVYDGEKIYRDIKTGRMIGCEHCIDYQFA